MTRTADPGRQSIDYERHGHRYARHRRPDPRIAARVHAALGDARTVVNVGAGAGSAVRSAQSIWPRLPAGVEQRAVRALEADLTSGARDARHGRRRREPDYHGLLTLVICEPS
jgi:hypothetical protein